MKIKPMLLAIILALVPLSLYAAAKKTTFIAQLFCFNPATDSAQFTPISSTPSAHGLELAAMEVKKWEFIQQQLPKDQSEKCYTYAFQVSKDMETLGKLTAVIYELSSASVTVTLSTAPAKQVRP